MKKQIWAGVLMAGLCQVASASTVVTFEGNIVLGTKSTNCNSIGVCDESTPIVDPMPFKLSFAVDFGTNLSYPMMVTRVTPVVDPVTGESYDNLRGLQYHARWSSPDWSTSQVPAVPLTEDSPYANGVDGLGGTFFSSSVAMRYRTLTHWFSEMQGHHVSTTAHEGWTLGSTLSWQNGQEYGFQNTLALSSSPSFPTTLGNFGEMQSSDYFLSVLTNAMNCTDCVRLNLSQIAFNPDGTVYDVQLFGFGRISSLVTTSAVPEPSTYVLMFAGLGVLGAVVRRKRRA